MASIGLKFNRMKQRFNDNLNINPEPDYALTKRNLNYKIKIRANSRSKERLNTHNEKNTVRLYPDEGFNKLNRNNSSSKGEILEQNNRNQTEFIMQAAPHNVSQADTDYMFDHFDECFDIYFSSEEKQHQKQLQSNYHKATYQQNSSENEKYSSNTKRALAYNIFDTIPTPSNIFPNTTKESSFFIEKKPLVSRNYSIGHGMGRPVINEIRLKKKYNFNISYEISEENFRLDNRDHSHNTSGYAKNYDTNKFHNLNATQNIILEKGILKHENRKESLLNERNSIFFDRVNNILSDNTKTTRLRTNENKSRFLETTNSNKNLCYANAKMAANNPIKSKSNYNLIHKNEALPVNEPMALPKAPSTDLENLKQIVVKKEPLNKLLRINIGKENNNPNIRKSNKSIIYKVRNEKAPLRERDIDNEKIFKDYSNTSEIIIKGIEENLSRMKKNINRSKIAIPHDPSFEENHYLKKEHKDFTQNVYVSHQPNTLRSISVPKRYFCYDYDQIKN